MAADSDSEERYRLPRNHSPRTPSKKSLAAGSKTPRSGSAKRKSETPVRRNRPSTSRQSHSPKRGRRRYRPGKKALKEIKTLQASTKLCIKKLPFSRLVREIQLRQNSRITHWQVEAIAALQEAAEAYLIRFLEDCNEAAMFARRVTVMQRDFQFINKLRGRTGGY